MARGSKDHEARPERVERAVLAVPVALALTGALIASFADAITGRARRRRDADRTVARDRDRVTAFDEAAAGVHGSGGPKGWILRLARRQSWRWVGRLLQVQQRFGEVRGGDLAAALTLQAFLGLFPLLIFGVAVLGFVQHGSAGFADDVIDNLGLDGDGARIVRDALETASNSRRVASIVGLVGLLWTGLGFTAALRLAYNQAWQVSDRGLQDRLVGLVWFAGSGVLFLAGVTATASVGWVPGPLWPLALALGLAVNFALFLWTARVLPNLDVGWRPLMPGATLGALGLEALKFLGAYVVPRTVASASALWGTLGVVFAVLAWLLLFGRLVVYTAVLDVVLYEGQAGTVVSVVEQPRHRGATREATRGGSSRPEAPPADSSRITVPIAARR